MGYLKRSARMALNGYSRKGGKTNRRKQVDMAIRFAGYLEVEERLRSWDRLSARHVIRFYTSRRELAPRTSYNQYLAICELVEQVRPDLVVPVPIPERHGHPPGNPGK